MDGFKTSFYHSTLGKEGAGGIFKLFKKPGKNNKGKNNDV